MRYIKPLQLQAYEALKEKIANGELLHNTIYSETKISQELGISRTPLRDAVQRLCQEGYIDVIPSKGFRIHEMTEKDLRETCQIRSALEGFCVTELAKNCKTPEAIRVFFELESLIQRQHEVCSRSHSAAEFAIYDDLFHEKIIMALQNQIIADTFESYHYRMSSQTIISLEVEGRMEETITEHEEMLKFMRIGAIGRSYKASLAHLEKAKSLIKLATTD